MSPSSSATRLSSRSISGSSAHRCINVVLLDEPFAGVDAQTAQHIAFALDDWLQDKTVIYFVHQVDDANLLPGVEHYWRLAEGQLIADTGIDS